MRATKPEVQTRLGVSWGSRLLAVLAWDNFVD